MHDHRDDRDAVGSRGRCRRHRRLPFVLAEADGEVVGVARAAGFDEVGVQRNHGQLDGKWTDCVMVERIFGPAAA